MAALYQLTSNQERRRMSAGSMSAANCHFIRLAKNYICNRQAVRKSLLKSCYERRENKNAALNLVRWPRQRFHVPATIDEP